MAYIRNNRVDIYTGNVTYLPDGNTVAGVGTLVKSQVPCAIHQWHNDPQDSIVPVGITQNVTAQVYFDITQADGTNTQSVLDDRYLLFDQSETWWLIRGDPEVHTRFIATQYISALLEKQTLSISGLPIEDA